MFASLVAYFTNVQYLFAPLWSSMRLLFFCCFFFFLILCTKSLTAFVSQSFRLRRVCCLFICRACRYIFGCIMCAVSCVLFCMLNYFMFIVSFYFRCKYRFCAWPKISMRVYIMWYFQNAKIALLECVCVRAIWINGFWLTFWLGVSVTQNINIVWRFILAWPCVNSLLKIDRHTRYMGCCITANGLRRRWV